jgi:lactate dehydrogenase-like 2-hydroxyacid dehydrogenase
MAVGIVGLGAIGRATAERLVPFGCEIAWTGPRPKPDAPFAYNPGLLDLARWADALIVAAPLSPETKGMIDAEVLAALGPEGILVNVGRGPLVDEDALIDALRGGRLGAAALDVFEQEPTPAERWRDVPNTVLSPHTAGVTHESFIAMTRLAADHAKAFLRTGS